MLRQGALDEGRRARHRQCRKQPLRQ
jgi:hypothetical protein